MNKVENKTNKVVERFKGMMNVSMALVVLDVIVGVLFVFFPTALSNSLNLVLLGSLITIHGLFYVIRYVYDGIGYPVFRFDIIFGFMATIIGVFTVFNPFKNPLDVIGIFFGMWMLINGFEKMIYAIKLGKAYDEIFALILFISLLKMLMGAIALINPFEAFMLIVRLIGFFLFCDAAFELMSCRLFKSRVNAILLLFQ